jgi:PAS domain S-box-containing protein
MTPAYSTEELQERERLYHTVFDSSPDAIFIEDLEGNVLDANPAACRLHGVSRDQLIGKNAADLVPKDHRHKVLGDKQLVDSEVESYSLHVDGRKIPVSIRSSSIVYMGRPAVLLHVRNISARKKAQAAMVETQQHYKLLFNSHPQPMWVHDMEAQRFVAVNDAAVRLYKYSLDEFLAMENLRTIVMETDEDDSELLNLPKLVKVATARHRRKDGLILHVELSQHTIAVDGRYAGFVMISKIISSSR